MLLALDTASRQAGLALYNGEVVCAEALWHSGMHHTEWLAPALDDALRRINASASELVAVAVTRGPGSFTGLRVAMSLGKGIAAARGLPIFGVGTLDVTAYPHVGAGRALCAALPAGRGRHAFAFYGPETGRATVAAHAGEPAIAAVAGIAAAIAAYEHQGPLRVIGEWTPAERRHLEEVLAGDARVDLLPPALSVRRPAALAALAWQRYQVGEADDLHRLEPLYLHLPTAGGT